MDITCCRIAVATDSVTNTEYLICSNVFPAPELSKEAAPRGRKSSGSTKVKWPDWETALSGVTNSAVASYFKKELDNNRESYLRKRILRFRASGKRRWFMSARQKKAYIWQSGRFEGDVKFWRQGLSKSDDVKPVKHGTCLRLFLYTANDFQYFHDASTKKPQSNEWLDGSPEEEMEEAVQE